MMQVFGPSLTVVIPTYEERDNIRPLVARLDAALAGIDWEAVFVDDDSRDGTGEEVRALAAQDPRVRLLHRVGRRGLSSACVEGILSSIAGLVAVIDADLQHDERRLTEMFRMLQADPALDLVVGSRRVAGGSVAGGLSRLRAWGSGRANALARRVLGIAVSDPMSGFFMLRRRAFNEVACGLQAQGFKILVDMLAAAQGRWKVAEIGYDFRPRLAGRSKMSASVTLEFLALLVARLTGGVLPVRFVLFALVGLSGVAVQLVSVRLGLGLLGARFGQAQALGIFLAMSSNFLLNNRVTYRERRLRGRAFLRGLASFYLVCAVGALANLGVAAALFRVLPVWFVASAAGAVAGAVWNFWASLTVTWRAR